MVHLTVVCAVAHEESQDRVHCPMRLANRPAEYCG